MDAFSLVTLTVLVLLIVLVARLWRKAKKSSAGQRPASSVDEASAPEGAFGALVAKSSHSTQEPDAPPLNTQPPDFADTVTGGPHTDQNRLPPEPTEEETQDLLKRLHEAAALDAQEAAKKQTEQRAHEQAALARELLQKKKSEEEASKRKALQDRALLAQAQAAAAELAKQLAAKERLAAEAAREKTLLEKLRAERLERERLQHEQLEREQEQARQERAAAAERKTRQAQALAQAAQKQQLLEAKKRQEEEQAQARAAAEQINIAPQPPAPPAAQHGRRAADIVVMVADDSKVVRVKANRLLTKYQYQVLLAEDGADAAAQMQATLPDLLITDVEMPGMDGFELTRHMRSHARTAHVPIIMITAADDKHRAAAQEAGVNVLLGKPYDDEDLIARIRSTLRAA